MEESARNTPKLRRRPGRPAANEARDARAALLQAARELFAERDIGAVSSREIARSAGVNQALINYYFGGKQGLYQAMLQDSIGPVLARLESMSRQEGNLSSLPELMRLFTRTLAANPWVPRLILREVLSEEGRFREPFIRLFAGRGSGFLSRLLEEAQQRGEVRADLDIRLATLSWVSLSLFPFLAMPVASRIFDLQDTADLYRLADHSCQLFLEAIRARTADTDTVLRIYGHAVKKP